MAIKLHELIDQVREELLMPRQANTPDAMYPFLFVDEIEIQVGVTVSTKVEGAGKVNIQVIEAGGNSAIETENIHHLKIKLTPLLTKDEVRDRLITDDHLREKVETAIRHATLKEELQAAGIE